MSHIVYRCETRHMRIRLALRRCFKIKNGTMMFVNDTTNFVIMNEQFLELTPDCHISSRSLEEEYSLAVTQAHLL